MSIKDVSITGIKIESYIKPLLIIGCGHNNNNDYRISNCESTHEGAYTIDIDPNVKPNWVIDMDDPSGIDLGIKFIKIVFDGYNPSFWNVNVIWFLLTHLIDEGSVHLSGHPRTSRILTGVEHVDSSKDNFIHKYTKIFDHNSLNIRLKKINESYSKPNKILTATIDEAIKEQDFNKLVHLVEQQHRHISREDAYKIAKSGSLKFIKYIVENTPIIAIFCSPNDETEDYLDFFQNIPFHEYTKESSQELFQINVLYNLSFIDGIFDARLWVDDSDNDSEDFTLEPETSDNDLESDYDDDSINAALYADFIKQHTYYICEDGIMHMGDGGDYGGVFI